jgi:hypothetical protein
LLARTCVAILNPRQLRGGGSKMAFSKAGVWPQRRRCASAAALKRQASAGYQGPGQQRRGLQHALCQRRRLQVPAAAQFRTAAAAKPPAKGGVQQRQAQQGKGVERQSGEQESSAAQPT